MTEQISTQLQSALAQRDARIKELVAVLTKALPVVRLTAYQKLTAEIEHVLEDKS